MSSKDKLKSIQVSHFSDLILTIYIMALQLSKADLGI